MSEIKEVKEFSSAIRRLIVESGRLAVKGGGEMFSPDYRKIIIDAVQEYNEKAALENTGEILINSNDFR
jgi:hypothetical protein